MEFEIIKEVLAWIAVVLTASQFLPQVWKTLRTKSTRDLSWWTFIQTAVLTLLWVFYGIWHNAVEIIVANTIINVSCYAVLAQKYITERPKLDFRALSSSRRITGATVLISTVLLFLVIAVVIPYGPLRTTLGWITVVLNATQFFPQALKAFKTKSTRDLSWWTFIQISIVTILWVLYGFWNGVLEVIVSQLFVHVSCDAILVRKYLSEKK